jgi:hypothetical protein
MKSFTVERIYESIGISKEILYEWTESDAEFTTALGRLKDVQENDPLKTGTEIESLFGCISSIIAHISLKLGTPSPFRL